MKLEFYFYHILDSNYNTNNKFDLQFKVFINLDYV